MFVGDRERTCVVSESCRIFPRDPSVHFNTPLKYRKNPNYEMWKEQILSSIGEDPDFQSGIKRRFLKRKTFRNHSYHKFCPVLAKIRINRVLLYPDISLCG